MGRADDPGPDQDPTDVQGRGPRADARGLPRVDEKDHIRGLADAIPGHAPSPAIDKFCSARIHLPWTFG